MGLVFYKIGSYLFTTQTLKFKYFNSNLTSGVGLNYVYIMSEDTDISENNLNGLPYLARCNSSEIGSSTGVWKEISVTFNTRDSTSVKLALLYAAPDNVTSAEQTLYLDDLSLVRDETAPPTYFNDDFTVNNLANFNNYADARAKLSYEKGGIKVKNTSVFGNNVTSAPFYIKKGAKYTVEIRLDISALPAKCTLEESKTYLGNNFKGEEHTNFFGISILAPKNGGGNDLSAAVSGAGSVYSGDIDKKVEWYANKGKTNEWDMRTWSSTNTASTGFGKGTSCHFSPELYKNNIGDVTDFIVTCTFTSDKSTAAWVSLGCPSQEGYYVFKGFSIKEENALAVTEQNYIDDYLLNKAVKTVGVAIRSSGNQGMRYKTKIDNSLFTFDNPYKLRLTEYGTIAIKSAYLGDNDLSLEGEYNYNGKTKKPIIGKAYSLNDGINTVYSLSKAKTQFTGVLVNIDEQNWDTDYTVRTYFKFVNQSGDKSTFYLETNDIAIYPIAKRAYSARKSDGNYAEKPEVRQYIANSILSTSTDRTITVNEDSIISDTFQGLRSTVYHATAFMEDDHGRTYTDEMAALEMDRLVDCNIDNVRTRFPSDWAWNWGVGWNWDENTNKTMAAFYKWAKMLQDRDISITINANWSITDYMQFYDYYLNDCQNGYTTKQEVAEGETVYPYKGEVAHYMHGYVGSQTGDTISVAGQPAKYGEDKKEQAVIDAYNSLKRWPDDTEGESKLTENELKHYAKVAARYGEWVKQALKAFKDHGIYNVKYIMTMTEPAYANDDPYYCLDEGIVMLLGLQNALNEDDDVYREDYKIVGPNQSYNWYQAEDREDSNFTGKRYKFSYVEYVANAVKGTAYEDMIDVYSSHTYTRPNTYIGYENDINNPYASYSNAKYSFAAYNEIFNVC